MPAAATLAASNSSASLEFSPRWVAAAMALVAIAMFGFTWWLTAAYRGRRLALGAQWLQRGEEEMAAGRAEVAAGDFRSALLYAPDDPNYRLDLARALLAQHDDAQARSYFEALLQAQPGDGFLNLEMARIAAELQRTEEAQRYYQSAIYGVWPEPAAEHRRQARMELVSFLVSQKRNTDAAAQAVALSDDLPQDPPTLLRIAELCAGAGEFARAASIYSRVLNIGPNSSAEAGLGLAEFQMEQYAAARPHLQAALLADPGDQRLAAAEQTAALVTELDPFNRAGGEQRRARVLQDFAIASRRLDACFAGGSSSAAASDALAGLRSERDAMAKGATTRALRVEPDRADQMMDFAFAVENQTNPGQSKACGPPAAEDDALLRISRVHSHP